MQAPAKNTNREDGGDIGNLVQRSHEVDELKYRMNNVKRGRFIIINNETFNPATGMGVRKGTDVDSDNLKRIFGDILGFEVVVNKDMTRSQMLQLMIAEAGKDHSDCDCFGVAVLSHGDQGILYGIDEVITIESFMDPIKDCKSLDGKPKLFFFQACRGSKFDDGVEVKVHLDSTDGGTNVSSVPKPKEILLPREADFLYAYSTVPGYYAWRNTGKGSWFVQALTANLEALAFANIDLVRILTRVNHEVAYEFESSSTAKKEVPSVVSMLLKDLYFTRK